jgi:hypothetical protein
MQAKEISEFLQVAAVEEYGRRHSMQTGDVLDLFERYNLLPVIDSQYDVLHTLDPDEACDFAEDYMEARK